MRRLLLLCSAVAGLATVACSSSVGVDTSLPATSTDVVGTFSLTTANGFTPPYQAFVTATEIWTLTSDRMSIAANNTWADTTNYGIQNRSDGSETTRSTASAGTWTIANNQINFTMTTGGTITFVGSVTGNTLTAIQDGKRYYYTR